MKHLLCIAFFCLPVCCMAQVDDFRRVYDEFRNQAKQEYEDFRIRAIKEYAEFVRQAWQQYKTLPAVPKPKDEELPPVVIKDEDKDKPIEDKPVVIEDVIDIPAPQPQPTPVAPIKEQSEPVAGSLTFTLYGTPMTVRANEAMKFRLNNLQIETIADIWDKRFATHEYNNIIRDCLENRIRFLLSDWAYLRMLDTMCGAFLGQGTNEAELLKAFIYCQSGYQMRLAMGGNRLLMLYASEHYIYNKVHWYIGRDCYYHDSCEAEQVQICEAAFPGEKALSLYVPNEQLLAEDMAEVRMLQSYDVDWLKATVSENQNLMAFCNDYPSSYIGDDFMTRWAMYANMPLSTQAKNKLYPKLKEIIQNRSLAESVDVLCHWVQTAFVYEYDDKVWGDDRAFFADETLYYPYCDCEDRSILLTRIVRDLLGLKCALVYYPGHLAIAIAVGEEVKGDFIRIEGTKYIVCDPTYIGAPIGKTMPGMDNQTAKVIVLM